MPKIMLMVYPKSSLHGDFPLSYFSLCYIHPFWWLFSMVLVCLEAFFQASYAEERRKRPESVLPELTLANLCTLTLQSPQTNVQKIYTIL